MDDRLTVGHGSSRPLTPGEKMQLAALMKREVAQQEAKERKETEERYRGYRYWCSEGCGFVDRNHRCEQWAHITYVPPSLYAAICAEQCERDVDAVCRAMAPCTIRDKIIAAIRTAPEEEHDGR